MEKGDHIRVIDGSFSDMEGVIDKVDNDKGEVTVTMIIFGRSTPIVLSIAQIAKIVAGPRLVT